uniref:[histone H3]-lysine(4) N-trimethyltransferase n=1 Tax=Sinocyclocheilus rhinocerous TaxID=307959 RepID=A0A673FPT1_9TELE
MSSRKDDDNLLRMTKDDLQRWIQAEVERNPHLVQRREQLVQVEEWVKQKERESTYTHLLYGNAHESVLECESVMKGLYGMLGLEYRDEDSEEEGGGGEPLDVIHVTDEEEYRQENSVFNGDDDDIVVIDLGATKETLEPMLEKVTVAIQKSSRLVQDLVHMVNKTSFISAVSPSSSSSDFSNRPSSTSTPETSRSESVTSKIIPLKMEIPENSIAIVKTQSLSRAPEMSSLLSNSEQKKSIACQKPDSKPTIKTEPQPTALTPWEMSISNQHETAAGLNCPSLKLIKTEPQLTAVSPSETLETIASPNFGSIATIKTEPQSSVIKPEMTSPPSISKPFKISSIKTEPQPTALTPETSLLESDLEQSNSLNSDHEAASNTGLTLLAMSSEIPSFSGDSEQLKVLACPNSASVASNETDPQVPLVTPAEMSSPPSSSEQMETAASESTTEIPPEVSSLPSNSEEAVTLASRDSESTDETGKPKTRSKSAKPSVPTISPTTRLRSSKNTAPGTSTSCPQRETTRASSPADNNNDPSDTEDLDHEPPKSQSELSTDTTDDTGGNNAPAESSSPDESSKSSSSESSKPSQEHKEIKLNVSMGVLGKRQHNVWCKGTVQEVQTAEDGLRYKVEFKSGKEIVLPAHHVASLKPPVLKDLFIGCRVVASSKDDEGKVSFNAAVLVELPERKNRMRFLVFYDDGQTDYLALPDFHVVCKQCEKFSFLISLLLHFSHYILCIWCNEMFMRFKVKKTIEATSLCSGGPVDVSAGYTHKRLPTTLPTGVYECNPLCRCDPRTCSNRLVQHGLQLRLELFMTQHKGWGIRCKDDVAKGTFVCVFTGKIINEDRMNEDDTVSGNDYLANLDFIEGVEKLKEGYESAAYCSDTEVESNKKTITMKTGPLWKNTLYQEDSSSSEEPMELDTEQEMEGKMQLRKLSHKPHETSKDAQKKVTKQMREDGQETSGPKRCFARKSFQRRVKPLVTTDAKNEKTRTALTGNNTRRLFNGEETCYIIDARQEGNLGRFINHSCSPNLFVQNVFVDTHDLRFPWVAFFASKRIKAGTEVTWDYNYEVGSVEGKVLLCCCGSLRCTGRLL